MQSPAAVLNVDDGDQVTGGMVCEALTLMAAGRLNLRPGSVKVYLLFSASPSVGVLIHTDSCALDSLCFLNLSAVYDALSVSCPASQSTLHAVCTVLDCMLHLLFDLAVQSQGRAVRLIAWVVNPG